MFKQIQVKFNYIKFMKFSKFKISKSYKIDKIGNFCYR